MDNLPPVPQPPSSSKTKWWMAGGISLGVIVILFAFYLFRSTFFSLVPNSATQSSPETSPSPFPSPLATIVRGTITKINGSTLSVTDHNNQPKEFQISKKVVINKLAEDLTLASTSADLKDIEVGKLVSIVIEPVDGESQVIAITYFPPSPK